MTELVTGLMTRETMHGLVRKREEAMELAHRSWQLLRELSETNAEAIRLVRAMETRYNVHMSADKSAFVAKVKVPDLEEYVEDARRIIDTEVWTSVMLYLDLDRMMDKTAKDEFARGLLEGPPEVTYGSLEATVMGLAANLKEMFARGLARAFADLDRRFKSHDGWKIGSRIILTSAMDAGGGWSYHTQRSDTIRDVERVFYVLDGKMAPSACELVETIREARKGWYGPRQSTVETPYFRAHVFLNGNVHIWFLRDDLVVQVNKLLAEYYGEVLGDSEAPEDDGGLNTPKTSLAKNFGFFPTPEKATDILLGHLWYSPVPLKILEPSAGTGNLARACVKMGHQVYCVEIQQHLAEGLRAERRYAGVICADFLQIAPPGVPEIDAVVMNPPFDRERDIDHVMHAVKFLKPGGQLLAIMSAGTEFRETRKSIAFRKFLAGQDRMEIYDMPAGSFSSVGTNVNTRLVRFRVKP